MSEYMADISSLLQSAGVNSGIVAKNSTSRKNNTDLDMTDFLQLMVVQLQSQTMDDSMDTSEMMNQLVQMQMVTAITNMTEASLMSYASSLVGKEVTIGIVNGDSVEERVVEIIGTGYSDGQQVLFGSDGETYALNQIMAVGRLPEIEGVTKPEDTTKPGDTTNPTDPTNPTNPTNPTDPTEPDKVPGGTDNPAGGTEETENNPGGTQYEGEQGTPAEDV